MEPQTDTVNSKLWLGARRETKIAAYIENRASTLNIWEGPSTELDFYAALRQVSVSVGERRSIVVDHQLNLEFQAWDVLSDDALMDFEQNLD